MLLSFSIALNYLLGSFQQFSENFNNSKFYFILKKKFPLKVSRTYDQDADADLWRESGLFIKKKGRYICFSKTAGVSQNVVEDITVINEREPAPEGFSMISQTIDSSKLLLSILISYLQTFYIKINVFNFLQLKKHGGKNNCVTKLGIRICVRRPSLISSFAVEYFTKGQITLLL